MLVRMSLVVEEGLNFDPMTFFFFFHYSTGTSCTTPYMYPSVSSAFATGNRVYCIS